jgi:eukaryotic-like serine/threonine-protein kinase
MAWRFARPVVQLGVAASKLDWPRSKLEPMISPTPLASRSVFPGSMSSPVPLLSLAATIEMRLGSGVTVEGEIGRGGMSRVYAARRTDSNERIAVKVMVNRMNGSMTSDKPGLEERFLLEMRILQKLSHPNIPAVLEAGEANGMLFFTMPFIEGGSLRARIRSEGKLPIRDALVIARDAADALAHAHVNGVIHRDVKPDNLLLSPTGAVLLDFGIARAPSLAPPDTVVDKPGYVMGTAEYTSPERVSGRRPEDARSDLFSLGCVLYEMLAGKTPFPGGVRQLMKEAGSDLSPNMDALPANLPDDVIGVLRRSLAAYPSDRFATARAMSAALTAAIEKLAAAA